MSRERSTGPALPNTAWPTYLGRVPDRPMRMAPSLTTDSASSNKRTVAHFANAHAGRHYEPATVRVSFERPDMPRSGSTGSGAVASGAQARGGEHTDLV